MKRAFTKYSANGNHFVLFDHLREGFEFSAQEIRRWCDPVFGIGADGVAQITKDPSYDFRFRLWNADGGEAEMCGNAARAAAWHFLSRHAETKSATTFKTMNGVYTAHREAGRLWLHMSEHRQDLQLAGDIFPTYARWFYINTGVPHLVLEVADVEKVDLQQEAPRLRHHRAFPHGTNVDFISVADPAQQVARLRVFERGVEGETWSCGTGVAAVAWALRALNGWSGDMSIVTKGGEHRVRFDAQGQLWYSGEILRAFAGELA